jgi:hypothetical protein
MMNDAVALPSGTALTLLNKYCLNMRRNPTSLKFRRIRVLNPKFYKVSDQENTFRPCNCTVDYKSSYIDLRHDTSQYHSCNDVQALSLSLHISLSLPLGCRGVTSTTPS